jgi:dolichol-phosphate mannosyltransferase
LGCYNAWQTGGKRDIHPVAGDPAFSGRHKAVGLAHWYGVWQLRGAVSANERKLISIVIPVHNEEDNVDNAYAAVCAILDGDKSYSLEIIFTDNCSTDATFARLVELARRDPRVRVVRFARNFGFNRSLITGYRLCSGDAAIQLDCDLQDPPELFREFLKLWEQGHDVVVGVRRSRREPWWLQFARKRFYRLMERISDDNLVIDGGDFRLIDRRIIEQLRQIDDAAPFVRGLTSSIARNQVGVPYDRRQRQAGKSKYPLRRLFSMALEGFLAHSIVPLRLASVFGTIIASISVLLSLFFILLSFLGVEAPQGFTTIAVLVLFGMGVNAIFLGIIGEYLGRIYNQLRRRPTTVIASAINFDRAAHKGSIASIDDWRLWSPERLRDPSKER